MEHNNDVNISKKSRIMKTVKKFKEEIALHGHKNTKKEIISFEKDYFIKNNTSDQMSEEPIVNNSTFIKTSE